jgi:hypothetical protein
MTHTWRTVCTRRDAPCITNLSPLVPETGPLIENPFVRHRVRFGGLGAFACRAFQLKQETKENVEAQIGRCQWETSER